ncbi:MAG: hypothetical protein ACR2PY_02480 [Salinispira sp.]
MGALQWFLKGHILDVLTDERAVSHQAGTIIKNGHDIRVNSEQPGLNIPPPFAGTHRFETGKPKRAGI